MAFDLKGKFGAVTGAASGIGLASADAMLSAGARVVLVDRDRSAVAARFGGAAMPLLLDFLDPA